MGKVVILAVIQVESSEDQGGQLPVGLRAGVVLDLLPLVCSLRLLNSTQNITDIYLAFKEETLKISKQLTFKMQAMLLDCGRGVRTATSASTTTR